MGNTEFIEQLGYIIVAAALLSFGARFLKIPAIVAYLFAGLLLGPVTGLVEISHSLDVISETGIVLLLFFVGLELSLDKIKDVGKSALAAGVFQMSVTAGVAFVLNLLFGFSLLASFLMAFAVGFSSTVVVVKLLGEKGDTGAVYGKVSIAILLFQDLVVILLLTLLAGIDGASVELVSVAKGLGKAFAGMAVLVGVVLLASRFLLPNAFGWASRRPDTLFIWSLCWCFLVVVGAHALHLSAESGAFLAGFSLAQLPCHHEMQRRVQPMMNFFIAVFFVTLGIGMNLSIDSGSLVAALVLTAFALLGKAVIVNAAVYVAGKGRESALLAGLSLCQISEFSFILATMGRQKEILGDNHVAILGLVGLLSMSISAFALLFNRQLLAFVERTGILCRLRSAPAENESQMIDRSGHVIVIGMNTMGHMIIKELQRRGYHVLAIDTDPMKLAAVDCETMLGDASYASVLDDAGLDKARLLVSTLQIEDANDLIAFHCKTHHIPCAIHAIDLSLIDNLLELDVSYLMIPKVDGVKLQTRKLKEMGLLKS